MAFGPIITSGDLTLRPASAADADARRALGVNAEIARMFGASAPTDRPMTSAEAEKWFATLGADGSVEWVVEHAGDFVGVTRLHRFERESKRARYAIGLLDGSMLGRGLGTSVTRLVLRYGFDRLELDEIELYVLDYNERAQRCYRTCGFQEIARVPSDIVEAGRRADDIIMTVTPATFVP